MAYFLLQRSPSSKFGTFGTLFLVDERGRSGILCQTLEPEKLDNSSGNGISFGSYDLCMTYSPKFKCELPLLSIPSRSGIRIHAGNDVTDTCGCILVGVVSTVSQLLYSKLALQYVLNVIRDCNINRIQIIL